MICFKKIGRLSLAVVLRSAPVAYRNPFTTIKAIALFSFCQSSPSGQLMFTWQLPDPPNERVRIAGATIGLYPCTTLHIDIIAVCEICAG